MTTKTDATSDDTVGAKLHQTRDGLIWAEEFMKIWYEKFNCDPAQITTEWLHSWFANAIMCGFDHATSRERQAAKVLEDALLYLESEIIRGKDKDCIGCINGSDIPTETLCRACWRIWIGKEGYLLWDWKTSEMKINEALKLAKQIREGLK